MIISALVAMSSNRVIGVDGTLPWKIPEDSKFFRDKTIGRIMIMGRKTFESLPGLLPRRLHVVITRQRDYHPEGAHVVHSVQEALDFCRPLTTEWGDEVFVIGGGEIYKQMMSVTDRIYLTEIHQEFAGHAYFPEFDASEFIEIERKPRLEPMPFDFVVYESARPAKRFLK